MAANVVYEQRHDGRWVWHLYRFRASAFGDPSRYRFGPFDRLHGFDEHHFLDPGQRANMVQNPGLHVWRKIKDELAPDILLRLFQEGVELQASASRDPRW